MAGIVAYGVHIPRYRLSRKTISQAIGWLNPASLPGEKAVANYDEDSLTMSVAAGRNCLHAVEGGKIDGMYFATTTAPYQERESAAIIATVLDLRSNIRTADFTDSLKAGTAAILSGCDSIKARSANNILLCAADCRLGKPGGSQEMLFGDGAASLLLGNSDVIASLEDSYSVAYDFPDYRRSEYDKFVRTTEARFIRQQGYTKFIPEAVSGLLKKHKLEVKDISKLAFPCLDVRAHATLAKSLDLQPNQVQRPFLDVVGEIGVASPLVQLVAMLEEAKPGDNIILVSYGNGAEALLFQVTEEIERVRHGRGLKTYIDLKKELVPYEKYLVFRGIIPTEVGSGGEVAPTQLPLAWREQKAILALHGSKCKRCGTPQYPPQRVCVNPACGAIDEMEAYPFSDKKGTLFSYTKDYASLSLNPPLIYGIIEFEGGGRFLFDITDCEADSLKIGTPVEMTFRRKYLDEFRGISGYYWKATPVKE